MKTPIKTSHGMAILGACFLVAIILISQFSKQLNSVSLSIPPHTQLAQVSCTTGDLTCGLVGWWKFDEGSGTTAGDSSGSGNTGTLTGSPLPAWTTGKIGGALSFNGTSQYVNVGNDFIGANQTTVSAWIYAKSYGGYYGYSKIIDTNATEFGINSETQNGLLCFDSTGFCQTASANGSISLNTWVFVTATRDSSGLVNLYVNGVLNGAPNQSGGTQSAGSHIYIGNNLYGSQGFDGSIDDVRVYNRALSAAEVQSLYAGSTGSGSQTTTYTITASAGTGGTISPTGLVSVNSGNNQTFNIAANSGYQLSSVTVDGASQGAVSSYTFSNVTTAHSISATFSQVSSSDTQDPSVPTNLTATVVSSSQINLTWTASTDNVAVTGYNIYRGGTKVGTSPTNSYSDTGLTASTQYTYTVSAYDVVPNTSAQSTNASATTQGDVTGAHTYYIDYSTGNDSNNGTSQSTPWKHAPGDPSATGISAATTLASGNTVYFKGGVVYDIVPFSGTNIYGTAYTASGIIVNNSGSVGSPITYDGNDSGSWGTGKAIIDDQHIVHGSIFSFNKNVSNITIIGFELKNAGGYYDNDPAVVNRANGTLSGDENTGGTAIDLYAGSNSNISLKDLYIHDIGQTRTTKGWTAYGISGNGITASDSNGLSIKDSEFTKMSTPIGIYAASTLQNVDIDGNDLHDFVRWGIDVSPMSDTGTINNINIHNNKIHDFTYIVWTGSGDAPHTDGIFLRDTSGTPTWTNVNVFNNQFYEANPPSSANGGTASIYVSDGPSVNIYNNIFNSEVMADGEIDVGGGANFNSGMQIVRVYNNTFLSSGDVSIESTMGSGTNLFVENNLMMDVAGIQANAVLVNTNGGSSNPTVMDYDMYWSPDWSVVDKWIAVMGPYLHFSGILSNGFETHGFYTVPLLMDSTNSVISSRNFRPTSSSPVIGAGANLTSYCSSIPTLCQDYDGTSRPANGPWDIGAYQYCAGSSCTTPPPPTPINGSCSSTINQCTTGTFSDLTDTSSNYLWSCIGSNGGTTASCSLPITVTPPSGPVISNISASGVTSSGATIGWTTNTNSTSQVIYGLTTAYGSNTTKDNTLVTSHIQTLSGLTTNTTYHYKVQSIDASNNATTSGDYTFTTLTSTTDSDHDGVPDSSDVCPNTPVTARPVNTVGCPLPKATTFTTTNLSNVNLNSVSSFDISNNYGKISFGATTTPYVLIATNGSSLDLDSNVSITSGSISLNSTILTQLNKPATLTFNNISISRADLQILRDSSPCTGCKVVSYQNNTLVITVPGFSTYSIHDLAVPGDTIAPLVDITSPLTSTITQGTVVTLTASSTDNVGTAGVYFTANGSVITSTLTTSPYTTTWTPSAGTYNLRAIAYDAAKNYATSSSVTLTVNAPTDLCPNIDGVQTGIPGGMILSGGNCITPSSGGGGGGGSTSSGGSSSGSTGSFTPTVTQLSNQPSNCPIGLTCTPTIPAPCTNSFTRSLTLGSTGPDVKSLQAFLNSHGFTVSTTGVGSKGNESTYFGLATQSALARFQASNHITPSTGYFGPITEAYIAKSSSCNSFVQTIPSTTPASSTLIIPSIPIVPTPSYAGQAFTRTLKLGSIGSDVKSLQVFLNTHGFIVATSGNGSLGHESTYYGPATAAAVSRFQMAHALQILIPSGLTQGTGTFGPSTMKVVNGME